MQQNRYHKLLRVSIIVVSLILLFDGGFVVPVTKQLSDITIGHLANSIGIFASVPENEINVITAELTARERELDEREATLSEREIAARDFENNVDVDYSTYILSIILFILTVLIVLNYAMDYLRVRDTYRESKSA